MVKFKKEIKTESFPGQTPGPLYRDARRLTPGVNFQLFNARRKSVARSALVCRLFRAKDMPGEFTSERVQSQGTQGSVLQRGEIISWCPPQPRRTKNGSELVFHKVSWTLEEASLSPAEKLPDNGPGRRSDQVILAG